MCIRLYKIGGSIIEDREALEAFCRDFSSLKGERILVHGGGVMASQLQKALGQEVVKIEGRRVTDADALKAVVMSYAGWCNKLLVSTLQKYGCNAIGLAGCDGDVIKASRRAPMTLSDGVTKVDFGFVGDVTPESVNAPFLHSLLSMGLTPVICAINHDGKGGLLNTNADTVAASVAAATGSELICCFEAAGVLADRNDPSSVIPTVTEDDFARMKADGTVSEGMIPKIQNCLKALRGGATGAVIRSASSLADASGTSVTLSEASPANSPVDRTSPANLL